LDIGTAKPSVEQQAVVPHMGIDIVDPGDRYSAGRFAAEAVGWLAAVPGGNQPVVVGGTGFYIRALADGLFREPPMDSARRDRLRQWARTAAGLGRWAKRLDTRYSGGGRQRAARTIEVALLTGRPLSWWQSRAKLEGVMRPWYVQLTVPRAVLHARIQQRVADMLAAGLVAEVEAVLAGGVPADARGLDGVGYREVIQCLQGQLSAGELAEAIVRSTRRYAKRQETWFRHQLGEAPVVTLDATERPDVLAERLFHLWKGRGG
ncbi:MAG: hypothetical protein AMS18_11580, partial [Gemmatimonas sp. SG8_17]